MSRILKKWAFVISLLKEDETDQAIEEPDGIMHINRDSENDDNVCTAAITANKDILVYVQSLNDIVGIDSNNENEINIATPVPTSSDMRNIMKSMRSYFEAHSNEEQPNRKIKSCSRLNLGLNIEYVDSQMNSLAASVKLTYSASMVDRLTDFCLKVRHEIGVSSIKVMNPPIDTRSSLFVAKSESE
ncbi:hypothetical protein TNCV_2523611 [Trichonephila clavipes]|nr:hypothetical protein TNCV_2523611 [Trichonephila clavipes]